MAITVWCQERTDGSHYVVSTESGWQSQFGVKKKQITICVCYQQSTDCHYTLILADNSLGNI